MPVDVYTHIIKYYKTKTILSIIIKKISSKELKIIGSENLDKLIRGLQ